MEVMEVVNHYMKLISDHTYGIEEYITAYKVKYGTYKINVTGLSKRVRIHVRKITKLFNVALSELGLDAKLHRTSKGIMILAGPPGACLEIHVDMC